jgi:hypothetical protein
MRPKHIPDTAWPCRQLLERGRRTFSPGGERARVSADRCGSNDALARIGGMRSKHISDAAWALSSATRENAKRFVACPGGERARVRDDRCWSNGASGVGGRYARKAYFAKVAGAVANYSRSDANVCPGAERPGVRDDRCWSNGASGVGGRYARKAYFAKVAGAVANYWRSGKRFVRARNGRRYPHDCY